MIATDVDGTLADSNHQVTPRSLRALKAVEEAGIPVVIATGRSIVSGLKLARAAGLASPVAACTGALVADPATGEIISRRGMDREAVQGAVEVLRTYDLLSSIWTAEDIFLNDHPYVEGLRKMNPQPFTTVSDLRDAVQDDVIKFVIGGDPDLLDKLQVDLQESLGDSVLVTRPLPDYVDINHPQASKSDALQQLATRFGIDSSEVLVIGDSDNDRDMLQWAGMKVAPSNAEHDIRALAQVVIGHHDHEAVAIFLEDILRRLKV